ncbi:flagellin lysine-N-methylase [Priestia megaterium]|uniref:flagellin lysine-N-methylase n=1 Tax=Priestia megaterium TaxID=1404 RepID=UPI002E1E38CF|nr:flagellin lysine-N-methylase [Priestia megaterium]
MSKKMKKILVPQYLQSFSCIGSDCEDTCCAGWRVDVDKVTYKKYKNVKNSILKTTIEKNIKRNRKHSSEGNYAVIKMASEGGCTFLNEDKLCSIQLQLGEGFLSNTCAIYPRSINLVNEVIEKAATTSCPEIARLVLLNPKGIEFAELNEPISVRNHIEKKINTNSTIKTKKGEQFFWEIRVFAIQLLQNRECSVSERLLILGLFLQEVHQSIETNDTSSIIDSITKYTRLIKDGTMREVILEIPKNINIQLGFCKSLVDVRLTSTVQSKRYIECLADMIQGLNLTEEALPEDIAKNYDQAYNNYYKPFMDEHEYILENYLVNYVFKNLFPFGRKTIFNDYVILVIHYSMIKLHLIGMAGKEHGLNQEMVIKLIQSFSKTIEHNSLYLQMINSSLEQNRYNTMGYMAVLIMN